MVLSRGRSALGRLPGPDARLGTPKKREGSQLPSPVPVLVPSRSLWFRQPEAMNILVLVLFFSSIPKEGPALGLCSCPTFGLSNLGKEGQTLGRHPAGREWACCTVDGCEIHASRHGSKKPVSGSDWIRQGAYQQRMVSVMAAKWREADFARPRYYVHFYSHSETRDAQVQGLCPGEKAFLPSVDMENTRHSKLR